MFYGVMPLGDVAGALPRGAETLQPTSGGANFQRNQRRFRVPSPVDDAEADEH